MLLTAALPSFSNPSAEETSRLRVPVSANHLPLQRFSAKLIIERLFVLALVAMILGFVAYLVTKLIPPPASAPTPAAKAVAATYKTCRLAEFGLERWLHSEEFSQSSGWRDGGRSQQDWCNDLIASTVQGRSIGPVHEAKVLKMGESSDMDWKRHATYNYFCKVQISWQPLYVEKQDPKCGVE